MSSLVETHFNWLHACANLDVMFEVGMQGCWGECYWICVYNLDFSSSPGSVNIITVADNIAKFRPYVVQHPTGSSGLQ